MGLITYKFEWQEYRKKAINQPYTPLDAHDFEHYLASRLSTAEYKLRVAENKLEEVSYIEDVLVTIEKGIIPERVGL